jgi:hypothetical protein
MLLHVQSGFRGTVIDLDTGKKVPKVIWLNTDTGELEAYQVNALGEEIPDLNGNFLTYRAKGRFRFIPREDKGRKGHLKITMGAPRCALCPSPLTLPGDDLCVACRAKERGQRNRMKVERIQNPLLDRKCCKCSRLATWAVSDEVDVTPELGSKPSGVWGDRKGKVLYLRGAMVGRRYYCASCYTPPRLLDPRGEVIQDLDTDARPDGRRLPKPSTEERSSA